MSEYRDYDRCTRYNQDRNHPPCPYPQQPQYRNVIPVMGPQGPAGPSGATGPAGSGAIIPFASGAPVTLTNIATATTITPALIGFGSSAVVAAITIGGNIVLSTTGTVDFAFSVPRAGTITAVTAYFSAPISATVLSPTTIVAELYQSTTPNDTFTPIATSLVTLAPVIPAPLAVNTFVSGSTNLAVPVSVAQGTRLLMVFYATTAGVASVVTGYASAGVAIS